MKIAVLGTGIVGNTIGSKLIELGHEVRMGSRSATNEKAAEWVGKNGSRASQGTFADAAAFGEVVFNCTSGVASVEALGLAGAENLNGKLLVDVANPLDFSKGMPPTLTVCNTSSLGEDIQRAFPGARVVKTLNTMWCGLMVNPSLVQEGDHTVFVSGNDAVAKEEVKALLGSFGWDDKSIVDLGDITTARGTEMMLLLWVTLYGAKNTGAFNLKVVG
ncbi:NAD(P)-binding domain-containing protein [Paraflavisolibacter sp. H34]|uniref:NADPH-dependent F420 reductase n=1 Tax=Huijunlia imazamoxiresistens TaxID=3127457 RepID=UPI003016BAA1